FAGGIEHTPLRDLIQRAKASDANARGLQHRAHGGARRCDLMLGAAGAQRMLVHVFAPAAASGALTASARATRDTGGRPRYSEMNSPAMRSLVMSTPVSMPSP